MKAKTILLLLGISLRVWAQNVGINATGSTPNTSAMLDVSSSSKGLLIPNVTLSSTTSNAPIGASVATSLMVYNTAAAGSGATAVYAGYYYWDGAKWVRMANGNADAWLTTGNTGTTAGTNFLGTTDAVDLVFKTTGSERMRILSGGNVGINNSSPSEKLDVTGNIRFSGDLRPNNLPGSSNQILVSNGANTAPTWSNVTSVINTAIKTYKAYATRTKIPASGSGTGWTDVTGLSVSVTTTGPAILLIMTYGSIEVISNVGNSGCEVQLLQNGTTVSNAYQSIDDQDDVYVGNNGTIGLWSFQTIVNIAAAGTYVFKVQAHKYSSSFDNFYAGGNTTAPAASQNQGALIILEFDQ